MNNLLDNIAKATIEVFQQSADLNSNTSNAGMGLFNPNGIGSTDTGNTRQNGIKTFLRYFFSLWFFLQSYHSLFTYNCTFYLDNADFFLIKLQECEENNCL